MGSIFWADSDKSVLHKPLYPCKITEGGPCIPSSKMKQLETQISAAQQALNELLEQHRELRTQMNRVHNPTILRVPPEIASFIFQLSVPAVPLPFKSTVNQSFFREDVAAPLVLGAVCRDWRQIAWSTPRLWTFILVCLSSSHLSWHTGFIRGWLCRSGGLPVSIYVYTLSGEKLELTASLDSLIDIVNQYSNRWQTLDLRIPANLFSQFRGNSQPVSLLRSLRLQTDYWPTYGEFVMHNAIPRPIDVVLYHIRFKSVAIDWNNTTWADVTGLQVDECLELLKQASRLRFCKFSGVSLPRKENFSTSIDPIVHHQLQGLKIECYTKASMVLFFDNVTFLALENLSVNKIENYLLANTLLSFLRRSSCRLRELLITDCYVDDDDIISLLRGIPSLVRLQLFPHVSLFYTPDELFKLLARSSIAADKGEASDFLPELRFFQYRATPPEFPWDLIPPIFGPLSDLANPHRRPFQSLHIHFDQNHLEDIAVIDEEAIPPLLAILDADLDLEIGYPDEDFDLIDASMKHHGMKQDEDDVLYDAVPPWE